MPRPMTIYKADYAAMTADQIASHIETMKSVGKTPPAAAARALKAAREREASRGRSLLR